MEIFLRGGQPSCFLYRFVGKLSCSGVDQEGFPGLTPPSTAAENDLPVFQQNFAGYLYKGNMGKVDQQTFSAVEKRSLGVRQTVRSVNVQRVVKSP